MGRTPICVVLSGLAAAQAQATFRSNDLAHTPEGQFGHVTCAAAEICVRVENFDPSGPQNYEFLNTTQSRFNHFSNLCLHQIKFVINLIQGDPEA
jgi:hypothetical protein